jgi:hypothetical protein
VRCRSGKAPNPNPNRAPALRAGQANYGYGNAVCETVALERRRAGLPALALAWGAVDDAGYVAEVLQARPGGRARAPKGAAAAVGFAGTGRMPRCSERKNVLSRLLMHAAHKAHLS